MNSSLKYLLVLTIALGSGCAGKHLINDPEYMSVVEKSFNARVRLAVNRETELFSVFNEELTVEQTEALKFLYAFMPLSDLADYNGEFFLANADLALLTRKETSWGKQIPEDVFLHYVLPFRINNENLDSFRIAYYDEIMSRVKGLNLREAALEINHWCHEKVIYQPADIRTSAPMSTILSARGRCGEESTFTTAALRAAGIPARQVYTPRWAHSDDNHAWVEIWIDGEWFYMGACEPEPLLDRGWFTEPASRAMLVHTKSFGAPFGNENVITSHKNFSEINNLSKYAVTKKIIVKVSDRNGEVIPNALVEFKLYNYAEFYTLAAVPTDINGISRFETGRGDLLIWASSDGYFNYEKISVGETDTLFLTLNRIADLNYSLSLDLNVPVIRSPLPGPPPEAVLQNSKRIEEENMIRQNYIDSWITPEEIKLLASDLNLDSAELAEIFTKSMGNYNEIRKFLIATPDSLRKMALTLLEVIAEKDLRDTKEVILSDHLLNCMALSGSSVDQTNTLFAEYILNPGIENEILVAWRGYFRKTLPPELVEKARANPSLIVDYLNENITIAHDENYYNTPITPRGVNELKVSDSGSRSVCFVAICRTLGIASRLEPGRNIPQYYQGNTWHDVYFNDQEQPESQKGYIKLISSELKPVPEYYIHFTIARFENGRYRTLEYDYNKKVSDFREELALPPGSYMVVTGNRLNYSKILSDITFFNLAENEHKTLDIKLRKEIAGTKIIGKVNLENILTLYDLSKVSAGNIKKNGVVIIWIEPDKEPTKHIFNDIPLLKNELEIWGGYFLFLTSSTVELNNFHAESHKGLPVNSLFASDNQMNIFRKSIELLTPPEVSLPFVVLADSSGEILFASAGYRIGIGEQILKHIK